MGSVPWDDAAIELGLPPVHPAARQLVAGLERPDVLLRARVALASKGRTTAAP
jgi:hypothetical protein